MVLTLVFSELPILLSHLWKRENGRKEKGIEKERKEGKNEEGIEKDQRREKKKEF